jgi:myo-inositol-1(or 4)-monophosphatase
MDTTSPYEAERAFARRVIAEAAEMARGFFGRVSTTIKPNDPTQVLTEADIAIGRHLVDAAGLAYPDHNVIDEEAGVVDRGSAWTWVIDPIDGTSNFAAGIPWYAILVGLLHEGVPVVGAMALPAVGDIYTAARGAGVERNGSALPPVDDRIPIERRLLCYGVDADHREPDVTRAEGLLMGDLALACLNLRASGSAFDAAWLLESRVGASMYRTVRVWDLVALHALAVELGCIATTLDGRPLDYSGACSEPGRRYSWCVAPPRIHADLQTILARHPRAIA